MYGDNVRGTHVFSYIRTECATLFFWVKMSRLLRKGAEYQVSCEEACLASTLGTRDLSASAQAFIFPVPHHTWHLATPFFHPAQGLSPQELHRWSYPDQNCSRIQACLDLFFCVHTLCHEIVFMQWQPHKSNCLLYFLLPRYAIGTHRLAMQFS